MSQPTHLQGAVRDLLALLRQAQIECMLLGGLAIRVLALPRPTYDIDLMVGLRTAEVARLTSAALAGGFEVPEPHARGFVDNLRGLSKLSLGVPSGGRIVAADVFFAESDFDRSAFSRRRKAQSDVGEVAVISPEDLILMKLLANRLRDRADVADLLLVVGAVDEAYLHSWAQRLGVSAELTQALAGRGPTPPGGLPNPA